MAKTIYKLEKLAPKIVDAHEHIGPCRVFVLDQKEDELIKSMNEKGVDAAIVQPFPGAFPQPPVEIHDRIAKLAEKYPGRIFGLCSVNPHVLSKEAWLEEVDRCIKDLGFVGLKVHTIGHALIPPTPDGMMVFETAHKYKVPVMVHTGLGIPPALPALVIPAAKQYPDLPIILAHAGFCITTPAAIQVASTFKNVYLEWSWGMGADITWGISAVGADHNMFGSDLYNNMLTELVKAQEAGLTEDQLEWYLGKAAIKLFKLKL